MRKSTVISLIALLVSFVGLLIALIAYFKRRSCALCDDLDEDLVEYYDEDDEDDKEGMDEEDEAELGDRSERLEGGCGRDYGGDELGRASAMA